MLESSESYSQTAGTKKFLAVFTVISLFLFFVPAPVLSTSFGAFAKKDSVTVNRGYTATFEILFYSQTDEAAEFVLSLTESPAGLDIDYPESFKLDSTELKSEYVVISGEYVEGKVVDVDVTVPGDAVPGEHTILLKAVLSGGGNGGIINVNAEKTFLLKVNVVSTTSGSVPLPDVDGEGDDGSTATTVPITTSSTTAQAPSHGTIPDSAGKDEEGELNKFLVVIALILMAVFLILVYLNYKS